MRSSFNAIRRGYCVVTGLRVANAGVYPDFVVGELLTYVQKLANVFRKALKVKRVILIAL